MLNLCVGFDHQNGPMKDEFEAGVEMADEFLQVPMRKPRSKSVSTYITNFSFKL